MKIKPRYLVFGLILLGGIILGFILHLVISSSPLQIQTPSPSSTLSPTLLPSQGQMEPSLTPTSSPGGATYYKTEMKCQSNPDCYVCPPQTADSPPSTCQQGECINGYCYWKHNTNQCQPGYVNVCEAGMCECLKQ